MDSEPVAASPTGPVPVVLTRTERRRAARTHPVSTAMPWLVGLATLALRLATAANGPTDWDSAQYAAAVDHFDVRHGQPQPPGYWLYVESGRVLRGLTGLGTIHSLVVVAALASAVAAGLTAVAGRDLGGWWVGLAAGLVVATCPFAWFSGSIVATYSFDMVAGALLLVLAWRARPGSWHGVWAVVALGLLAGFRQSIVQSFAVLALIAVAGSTRRWSRLALTVLAGAVAVAVWLVPMAVAQPGGLRAWARATHTETVGAAHATSILDHAAGGATNLGTFAAYTVVALAPLAVLTVVAGLVLLVRGGVRRRRSAAENQAEVSSPPGDVPPPARAPLPAGWRRPWYQSRPAVLAAAIVPPVLLVALVEFAKGGYLLAYLPASVIVLLLPLAALQRHSDASPKRAPFWMVLTSVGVAAVVLLGAQRFVSGDNVLPQRWSESSGSLWLLQPRYQAPYPDTRAAITDADAIDTALRGLGPSVQTANDVVVFDTVDGGDSIYRDAGWSLPDDRIALIAPGTVLYNQLHGALYYASGATTAVGPAGSVLLVASPALPGLASLTAQGYALPVATPRPIGGYRVWRVQPGVHILGVQVIATRGVRPLGRGI